MSLYVLLVFCQVLFALGTSADDIELEPASVLNALDDDYFLGEITGDSIGTIWGTELALFFSLFSFYNAVSDTYFRLYTPENPDTPILMRLKTLDLLKESHFNATRPTRFIIHGYLNNENSTINYEIKEAYMKAGDFNVFVVDWSEGALAAYDIARTRIDDVGKVIAEFIDHLHDMKGVDLSTIYLIGHSLGAHIAGHAGRNVKSGRIPVIFGLDPAGVSFSEGNRESRLTKDDADYVETIHTDVALYGFREHIGHASFYPNYGERQIVCRGSLLLHSCHHSMSFQFFAESLLTKTGFWGKKCKHWRQIVDRRQCSNKTNEWGLMGGDPAQADQRGVYYLPTNDKAPFAKGKF